MSKRHWLRDEIDFGPLNNSRPHYSICDECEIGDDCLNCNAAAQEIADSLALYNMSCDREYVDHVASDSREMEVMAKRECSGFYFHGWHGR